MENGGLGLELDFRGEIKGEDQRDKREVRGKRKGLFAFLEILEKKKKPERKKERRRGEETKPKKLTSFGERKGDLAFQRAHTLKSSLRVKLGA